MNLNEQMDQDCELFFSPDEFGELHSIDGKQIYIVVDDDKLIERQKGAEVGVAESSFLFFARVNDLPKRKGYGSVLNIDGKEYTVDNWSVAGGIAQIALSQTRAI